MTIQRMHHVGIVVEDLDAAVAFFVALGLEQTGEGTVGGDWVDRIIGLDGARSRLVFLQAPDGSTALEIVEFITPSFDGETRREPSNAPGIRHLAFLVDDLDASLDALRPHGLELVGSIERYEDIYRLCYVRGPADIIVELSEELGGTS